MLTSNLNAMPGALLQLESELELSEGEKASWDAKRALRRKSWELSQARLALETRVARLTGAGSPANLISNALNAFWLDRSESPERALAALRTEVRQARARLEETDTLLREVEQVLKGEPTARQPRRIPTQRQRHQTSPPRRHGR
jgi:hypothetical protein